MTRHFGQGMLKGMKVTLKNLIRGPITTQYPEQKLNLAKRERGISLVWDKDKCIGCYTCESACPHGSIHIETESTPVETGNTAPCVKKCPAHVDAAKYVRAIGQGDPSEAVAIIRERLPLPSVCAYICAHPCESACSRGSIDAPVAIRKLKRYAVENEDGSWMKNVKNKPASGKAVAIIGAGPAGLTAAYYLLRAGHKVTIFEDLPKPGGMMLVGIPRYRLPEDILMKDVKVIEDMGCEFKYNTRIEDPQALLKQGYDALLLATGAHEAGGLGVPGEEDPRVYGGAYFLKDVTFGRNRPIGDRVVIVGGGNTAIDCCRTALRLGAKDVRVLYRRTKSEMPADPLEVEDAVDEGIKFQFLVSPVKVYDENGQFKMECQEMRLGAEDASGRRRPEPIPGSNFVLDVDTVIPATSQYPIVPDSFGVTKDRSSRIQVDKEMATEVPGVYAAGDNVLGPATVIEAVAQGRIAASSIDKYLGGDGNIEEHLAKGLPLPEREGAPSSEYLHKFEYIDEERRHNTFDSVELSWAKEVAEAEANRCIRCDLKYPVTKYELKGGQCIYCSLCVESCPFDALYASNEYERATYTVKDQTLDKEYLGAAPKSSYFHPELDETLPEQTLLLNLDKDIPEPKEEAAEGEKKEAK